MLFSLLPVVAFAFVAIVVGVTWRLLLLGLLLSTPMSCSMVPAVWYFIYLMGFYMKTSREVKVSTLSRLMHPRSTTPNSRFGTRFLAPW